MRILIVEDEKRIQDFLSRGLESAGYAVDVASDGNTAIELVHATEYDLIILDLMLPKLDGASVLRALKNDPQTAQIPVVVVTALSEKNEERLMLEGAAAFLEKGLLLTTDEPLLYTIKKVLQN